MVPATETAAAPATATEACNRPTDRELGAAYDLIVANGEHMPSLIATVEEDGVVIAVAIGWPQEFDFPSGRRTIAHLKRVIVHPKHRGGFAVLRRVRESWDALCRAHGFPMMTTPIEKTRPSVAKLGARVAGYIPYAEDEEFLWCYRLIPSASS